MWASIKWECQAGNIAVIMLCLLYIPSAGVTPLNRGAGFLNCRVRKAAASARLKSDGEVEAQLGSSTQKAPAALALLRHRRHRRYLSSARLLLLLMSARSAPRRPD